MKKLFFYITIIKNIIVHYVYIQISKIVIMCKGKCDIKLFEHAFNCGTQSSRMTERGLELSLVLDTLESWKEDRTPVIEVGAVTPYYFPGMIPDILDAYDPHWLVNLKMDLLDFDFSGYNIISVSTIEHVGTGDYGLLEIRGGQFMPSISF